MALVTRCPSCATTFRVTPLHLQAHGGDVRCGRCERVFNAFATLTTVQEPEAAEPRTEVADIPESTPKTPSAGTGDLPAPAISDEKAPPQAPGQDLGQERTQPEAITEAATREASNLQPPAAEEPDAQASDTASTQRNHTPADRAPVDDAAEDHAAEKHATGSYPGENYAEENYAFDRAAPRRSSLGWGLASLFLLVVLAAQAIYFYRAELSVLVPDARPYLEQYCELLECTVPLPQTAALLSIESSEMQTDRQRSGFVSLNATVRNHAPYAQAFPSFELTLTDSQDQPLASHIFSPDAYLEKYMDSAGAIGSNQDFKVKLHLDSGDLKAAGYRLHVFYPGS